MIILLLSYRVSVLINIFGKLPFSRESDCKKKKGVFSFRHEQNIICSQTKLDDIAHEQITICRQLFAGHVVGSRPMKRKKNLLPITIKVIIDRKCTTAGTRLPWKSKNTQNEQECHESLLV